MASVRQHDKMGGLSRRPTEMRWAVQTRLNKIIQQGSAVAFIVDDPDLKPKYEGWNTTGPRMRTRRPDSQITKQG